MSKVKSKKVKSKAHTCNYTCNDCVTHSDVRNFMIKVFVTTVVMGSILHFIPDQYFMTHFNRVMIFIFLLAFGFTYVYDYVYERFFAKMEMR